MELQRLDKVFGGILDGFDDNVKGGLIERCTVDTDKREIFCCCGFREYIKREELIKLSDHIALALRLNGMKFSVKYERDVFGPLAAEDIALELRASNVMLNGYFNGAEFNVSDGAEKNSITEITLKYGGMGVIKECNFERQFCNIVAERFGIEAEVIFSGQLENVEIKAPEYKQEPIKVSQSGGNGGASQSKPEARKVTGLQIPENADILPDTVMQVYGKKLSGSLIPSLQVNPEDDACLVWGEVFFSELVATKRVRVTA